MKPDSLAASARRLFDGLIAAGLEDVVISAGSRSTPWVLAALARSQLCCCAVSDERSAGFFALGQARVSGRPSLLLCTSGTASAHYLPAVLEASACNLPLLILSADRPLDRLHCGAPQVTDQTKLFGDHVRAFFELGEPTGSKRALRAVTGQGVMAATRCRWPRPGPVHFNARARKPLEPKSLGRGADEADSDEDTPQPSVLRVWQPRVVPSPEALDALASALEKSRRPVMVAGPAPLSQGLARESVYELSREAGLPLLADATSQLRFVLGAKSRNGEGLLDAGSALLGSERFRRRFVPDFVLQLGAAPVAVGWEEWMEGSFEAVHVVVSEHTWHDPVRTADQLIFGAVSPVCEGLLSRLRDAGVLESMRKASAEWRERLAVVNRKTSELVEEMSSARGALGEATVSRTLVEELPSGSLLMVGNSLPIRWLDLFGPPDSETLRVGSQRGVNGIDGLLSGAAGSTHALLSGSKSSDAHSRLTASSPDGGACPATAVLLGDVALFHDLGGLATLDHLSSSHPFVIVAINNDGGRIFEQLPVATRGLHESVLRHWTTPHGRTFEGVAETFGLRYQLVDQAADLRRAVRAAIGRAGRSLIEVRVAPDRAKDERDRLRREVDALVDLVASPASASPARESPASGRNCRE